MQSHPSKSQRGFTNLAGIPGLRKTGNRYNTREETLSRAWTIQDGGGRIVLGRRGRRKDGVKRRTGTLERERERESEGEGDHEKRETKREKERERDLKKWKSMISRFCTPFTQWRWRSHEMPAAAVSAAVPHVSGPRVRSAANPTAIVSRVRSRRWNRRGGVLARIPRNSSALLCGPAPL